MAIDSINGGYQASVAFDIASSRGTPTKSQDIETRRKIDKLKVIEQGVIAHELAHKGAGGAYAGAVNYTYTTGPDGKRYITGGEVSIDLSPAGSPEATVRKMRQVISAALAPVDPSGQDYRVASQAQALQLEAQQQQAASTSPSDTNSSDPAAVSAGTGPEAAAGTKEGARSDMAVPRVGAIAGGYAAAGQRPVEAPPVSISLYA